MISFKKLFLIVLFVSGPSIASKAQVNYLDSLMNSLEEELDMSDTSLLIRHINELSTPILFDALDTVRARMMVERTIELSELSKDTVNLVSSWGYMANVLGNNGWYHKSIDYSRKVLNVRSFKDSIDISKGYAFNHIGIINSRYIKNYDSATFYLEKGLKLGESLDHQGIILGAKLWLAYCFTHYQKMNLLDSAMTMAKEARDAESLNLVARKTAGHTYLLAWMRKYDKLDLWREMLAWNNLVNVNNQSSFQEALRNADAKYEVSYKDAELKLKEQEVALQEAAINRHRLFIVFMGLMLIFIAGALLYSRKLLVRNKKLAKRNELLVREQNHRVKNNLQMISSLLSLQAGKAQDEISKEALKQSQGRIQAIALLNRSLYDQEEIGDVDLREYVQELITEVINSITESEVRYELDIANIKLDLERTTSLGLIINELIVNSVKYVKDSVIEFGLKIKMNSNQFSLEYSDNGSNFDLDQYQNSKSFGAKLVQLQVKQLGGNVDLKTKPYFNIKMIFPK